MRDSSPQPTPRELASAVAAAVISAIIGIAMFLSLGAAAHGTPCRVHNYLPSGMANVGSGTLVDVTADGQRGLVLSCAHLFSEGAGRVVVEFPDGKTHGALIAAIDHDADLAALEIAKPQAAALPVSGDLQPVGRLQACGFGPGGEYQCAAGEVLGYSERPGQQSLRMAGAVRSGDSGGGVFDRQGRLVAVVWGESGGVTYASTGRPLAAFLERVLGRRRQVVAARPSVGAAACPDGRCPLVGNGAVAGAPAGRWPAAGGVANGGRIGCSCGCDERLGALATRLDQLQQSKQDRGDYALRSEFAPQPPSSGAPAALGGAGRAAGALAATALGLSGPVGWGVIAAASIGGWLLGRRWKRRSTAAAGRSFQGAPASNQSIERQQPIERDDREARELLRLSQLEGRDPLQDAVAGRLALDRLDALADSHADPQHGAWADKLRRELRERFNDIAPTKFRMTNDE